MEEEEEERSGCENWTIVDLAVFCFRKWYGSAAFPHFWFVDSVAQPSVSIPASCDRLHARH